MIKIFENPKYKRYEDIFCGVSVFAILLFSIYIFVFKLNSQMTLSSIQESVLSFSTIILSMALIVVHETRNHHNTKDFSFNKMCFLMSLHSLLLELECLSLSDVYLPATLDQKLENIELVVILMAIYESYSFAIYTLNARGSLFEKITIWYRRVMMVSCLGTVFLCVLHDYYDLEVYLDILDLTLSIVVLLVFYFKTIKTPCDIVEKISLIIMPSVYVIFSIIYLVFEDSIYMASFLTVVSLYVCYVNIQLKRLNAENERHEIASKIQTSMLIENFENCGLADVCGFLKSSVNYGSDFYDAELIDDDHLMVCVASVSGLSIAKSLFMMEVASVYKALVKSSIYPEEIVNRMNSQIYDQNKGKMKADVWLGMFNFNKNTLTYISAGEQKASLFSLDDTRSLTSGNKPLGESSAAYYHSKEIKFTQNERLVVCTKGFAAVENDNHELFDFNNIYEAVRHNSSSKDICAEVQEKLNGHFANIDLYDDLTMLTIGISDEKKDEIIKEEELKERVLDIAGSLVDETLNIRLIGDFTNESLEYFMNYLEAYANVKLKKIIIDCADLDSLSSAGLVAIDLLKQSHNGIDIVMVNGKDKIKDIIEITHFNDVTLQ